jgi:hypothetical protein
MSCSDKPQVIDEARVEKIFEVQRELRAQRHRGNTHDLSHWIEQSAVWTGALRNAVSVALIADSSSLLPVGSSHFEAVIDNYGTSRNLRPADHLFRESAWRSIQGTGVYIGGRRLLTAGHVGRQIKGALLHGHKRFAVFDFRPTPSGRVPHVFERNRNVFEITDVVRLPATDELGDDWATLKLETVPERSVATIHDTDLEKLDDVYVLGHSNGLLLRFDYSPVAPLHENDSRCRRAFVDGYEGGSGSPVFNAATHQIVGVLIRSCFCSFLPTALGTEFTAAHDCVSQICARELGREGSIFVSSTEFATKALATP